MATIRLEVVSPDRGAVLSKDIDMLIVRSTAGELGILPRHARLLTELLPYPIRIKEGASESLVAVGGGFMEVTPEQITRRPREGGNETRRRTRRAVQAVDERFADRHTSRGGGAGTSQSASARQKRSNQLKNFVQKN